MKYFILIFIALSTFSKAEANVVGTCKVQNVFTGNQQTIIDLYDCLDSLGFNKKRIRLAHHQSILVEEQVNSITQLIRFDNVGDALAIKQTAELCFLFQRRLRLEFINSSDEQPLFLSIYDSLAPAPSVAIPPNSPPIPPIVPPSFPDGEDFKPVPPPPKTFFKLFLSR
ncbi:MAG: hypothetical protein NT000_02615 [Proteobacteria bacterium]|nr:hypothetical protein [Pseudomonadota bacterium]NQW45510.1 hypothetical protein [Deltaproteobacteria bacterium]